MSLVDSQPPARRRLERLSVDERAALATLIGAPEAKGRETTAFHESDR